MLPEQQPLPQCEQDKGADRFTAGTGGAVVKQVERFKFLGVHITNKLSLSKHQDSREGATTTPIPPQETENNWHGSPDPQEVLQLHHQEHPDPLHGCLEWQLLGTVRRYSG